MNEILKIEKISQRIEFAISLLDLLFIYNEKIKIDIFCKLYDQDKKLILKINKSPFFARTIFNKYTFVFNKEEFDMAKSFLYKYFSYDWDYFISSNHSASFRYNKNEFIINCSNEEMDKIERILNKLIYENIITFYENIV